MVRSFQQYVSAILPQSCICNCHLGDSWIGYAASERKGGTGGWGCDRVGIQGINAHTMPMFLQVYQITLQYLTSITTQHTLTCSGSL